jgi:hypothetical protein
MTPYEMGKVEGRKHNYVVRGLMNLGLSMAADSNSERNTRDWLQGFKDGELEADAIRKAPAVAWGRKL